MGRGGLKYEDLQAGEMSNPTSMKSVTGRGDGKAGTSSGLLPDVASLGCSSEMLGGAGVGVAASILEEGLLTSALAADVGLEISSLDDGREWS